LAGKKEGAMIPFKKCPVCGGELMQKEVEKVVRGGNHTAILRVMAEVCLHCGERLYSRDDVTRFEEIRRKLERQETAEFLPVGQFFQVV
jgi:YgiT-type zinc finger domain-containing protein